MSLVSNTEPTFTSLLHQKNCEFITICVGRKKEFLFEKATLNQPHLKDSVFYREGFSSQNYYCDCDSELFEKYFINYIYFGVVPKWNQSLGEGVAEVILAMANAFKLTKFAHVFKKSRSEAKITIQFQNFSAELTVDSTTTVKDLITRFVKKSNKNLLLKEIKPESVRLCTHPNEAETHILELGIKLKNQTELLRKDVPLLFAFITKDKNHLSDWENLEAAENAAKTATYAPSFKAYIPPGTQESLFWKKT